MSRQEAAEVMLEFVNIEEMAKSTPMAKEQLFRRIAELDQKYSANEYYYLSVDGLLCNIGMDQKNGDILNFAAGRLKTKLQHKNVEKLHYDLGACLSAAGDLECPFPPAVHTLMGTQKYNEARRHFLLVVPDRLTSEERALTNTANLLEKYGRNFEAILLYDRVLSKNPQFGMACGNKAIAIEYYIRLAPQKSLRLMDDVVKLYGRALADQKLEEVGGKDVRDRFEKGRARIVDYLSKEGYISPKARRTGANRLSPYERFIVDNNLLLNYDFGYYYDSRSLEDTFFPSLVENVKETKSERNEIMSERIYFSFQVFNQILESYTTARLLYFDALSREFDDVDRKTNYVYTFDYTRHSTKYGLLKTAFCELYNCLDRMAHLMAFYFCGNDALANRDIYFDWLQTEEFRKKIVRHGNFQLLALMNLSLDFQVGYQYNHLKNLRNRMTHSFVSVNDGIGFSDRFASYETTADKLEESTKEMLLLVKAAIMYAVIAVKDTKPKALMFSMDATLQKDIYF